MAGKHSKNFFEKKSESLVKLYEKKQKVQSAQISLPFKIIFLLTVLSLCVSLVFTGSYFLPSLANANLLADASTKFEGAPNYAEGLGILESFNKDIKGWLKIDGTQIDCAVCQGKDDSFYLNHNQLGKKSRYGALFLSATDSFVRNGDKNIVIYGNNMKDGSMFGSLKKYRNINFYKQNPTVKLYYGNKTEYYIVFAVMLTDSSANSQKDYNPAKSYFADENEFKLWADETAKRSLINTNIELNYGDEILTLITSAPDFDGARLAVSAVKRTEKQISNIDLTEASVNADAEY